MNWQEFFKAYGDYGVVIRFYDCDHWVTLNKLYEVFAARAKDEKAAEANDLKGLG
jgi:hypothetical protein